MAGFPRPPAESALRLLGEALKRAWIVYREIGQDLAIQFHAALLQAVDELAVTQSVQFGGSSDSHNPQRAVLALLLLASGVGELQPALDGLFGCPGQLSIGAEI